MSYAVRKGLLDSSGYSSISGTNVSRRKWQHMSLWKSLRRMASLAPSVMIYGRHAEDGVYLRRWHLLPRNPVFNVYLHHFLRGDEDRALHDHPWHSVSILLRGRYDELTDNGKLHHRTSRWPVFRRASVAHRIILPEGQTCWTLFITGPKIRAWGFLCPQGHIHNQEFLENGCD